MTNITFFKKNDLIVGLEVSGHTGKDDYGKDLLCCQISTVAQLVVLAIEECARLKNFHEISDGYLKVTIDEKDAKIDKIQFLFETCFKAFKSIIDGEKKYAKMEVKNV